MTDTELWGKLRSGDSQSLKAIYENEFDYLYNYGRKICSETSKVEDSIQELFITIWNRRETLSTTDSIRKYLAISLKRKLIRSLKKDSKTQLSDEFQEYTFGVELDIEEQIINKEISEENADKIKEAFQKLSGRQKEVIYLKYYMDLNYEEIGESMDINYQSVRNLMHKALNSLGKYVKMIVLFLLWNI